MRDVAGWVARSAIGALIFKLTRGHPILTAVLAVVATAVYLRL